MSGNDDSLFALFVENALPSDCLVVSLSHVYVDESGTHDSARVMCLSGFIFEATQASRFARDWSKCLKDFGIPFAHMTDCANGQSHYKPMSKDDRVKTEIRLIENIKRRSKIGISIVIDPKEYEQCRREDPSLSSCYSFCMKAFCATVAVWADKVGYEGKFSYFFEAGHDSQSEANAFMNDLPNSNYLNEYRYLSHTFMDKKECPPLQAADMLAWQTTHYFERKMDGFNEPRKDFKALVRKPDYMIYYYPERLSV